MLGRRKKKKITPNSTHSANKHNPASHLFSADRPILSKEKDLLDRARFATALAKAIDGWNENDSLIVALYGPWGSGKSSVKNMALEALRSDQKSQATVVEFNPWQWAGQDQLAEAFFTEIGIALGKADTSKQGKRLAAKWRVYAQRLKVGSLGLTGSHRIVAALLAALGFFSLTPFLHISWVSTLSGVIGGVTLLLAAVFAWSAGFADEIATLFSRSAEAADQNLDEIKADLADNLSTLSAPVVIVIDDLDRLAPDEIRLMFQLVKANADFPNVVYLLLFQRVTIEEAIGERGREFLSKIVQVGFDLPLIQQQRVEKVLLSKLDDILGDKAVSQRFDGQRWANLYIRGLQTFFRTLRDVHRFGAVLAFEVGQFQGDTSFEVNPVDLIGLEVLRVFEPEVYQALSSAKSVLTGQESRGLDYKLYENTTKAAVEALLEHASQERIEAVREIIKQLFPPIEWVLGGNHYSRDFFNQWYRNLQVCHPDVFDRYFFLVVPEGDFSQAELDRVLQSIKDVDRGSAELSALKQRGLFDAVLSGLEAYKQQIDRADAVPFIAALFNVSEDLPLYSKDMFGIDPSLRVIGLIYGYLEKEPNKQQSTQIIIKAFQASSGLFMPVYFTSFLEDKENIDSLLEVSDLTILKQDCLTKIREASKDGRLASHPHMGILLYRWQEWSSSEEPKKWVASLIESKEGLLAFLSSFVRPARSVSFGSVVARTTWRIHLSEIESFIPVDIVEMKVKGLEAELLSEYEQQSLHAFERALERKRQGIEEDRIIFDE